MKNIICLGVHLVLSRTATALGVEPLKPSDPLFKTEPGTPFDYFKTAAELKLILSQATHVGFSRLTSSIPNIIYHE